MSTEPFIDPPGGTFSGPAFVRVSVEAPNTLSVTVVDADTGDYVLAPKAAPLPSPCVLKLLPLSEEDLGWSADPSRRMPDTDSPEAVRALRGETQMLRRTRRLVVRAQGISENQTYASAVVSAEFTILPEPPARTYSTMVRDGVAGSPHTSEEQLHRSPPPRRVPAPELPPPPSTRSADPASWGGSVERTASIEGTGQRPRSVDRGTTAPLPWTSPVEGSRRVAGRREQPPRGHPSPARPSPPRRRPVRGASAQPFEWEEMRLVRLAFDTAVGAFAFSRLHVDAHRDALSTRRDERLGFAVSAPFALLPHIEGRVAEDDAPAGIRFALGNAFLSARSPTRHRGLGAVDADGVAGVASVQLIPLLGFEGAVGEASECSVSDADVSSLGDPVEDAPVPLMLEFTEDGRGIADNGAAVLSSRAGDEITVALICRALPCDQDDENDDDDTSHEVQVFAAVSVGADRVPQHLACIVPRVDIDRPLLFRLVLRTVDFARHESVVVFRGVAPW